MIVFAFLVALAGQQEPVQVSNAVYYSIEPARSANTTELRVTMSTRAAANARLKMQLPQDCYGTPDLARFVRAFRSVQGSAQRDSAATFLLTADSSGAISVEYTLAYGQAELDRYAFAPNVGPGHFHVAGCQWLLIPENRDQVRRHVITLNAGGDQWHFYSSLGADPVRVDTTASYRTLIATALGGSRSAPVTFDAAGRPVKIVIEGDYAPGRDSLTNAVQRIIRRQRTWFADSSQRFYHVVILPRSQRLSGTSIPNLFVCFVGAERSYTEVIELIAHETTHNWIPNKVPVRIPEGDVRWRFLWFDEGVADYLSRTLLRDEGLMSHDRFVERVNTDLLGMATNPFARHAHAQIAEVARSGRTGGPFFRLPYTKGALMALAWDDRLRNRRSPDGLRGLMADLLRSAERYKAPLPEDSLFAIGARHGLALDTDFQRYVIQGEEIAVDGRSLGEAFQRVPSSIPNPLDVGFALRRSRASGLVQSVVPGGVAAAAGLRDGMTIVRLENENPLSPVWRVDQPVRVTVRVDGRDSTVSLAAGGDRVTVSLFRATKTARR